MRIPGSRLGVATLSNSSQGATRRWFTLTQSKQAAGTNVLQLTQGQTLMATIEGIFGTYIQSLGDGAVAAATRASMIIMPSLSSANTVQSGTVVFKEATKTLNKVWRYHSLLIGRPDPLRAGS